MRDMRCSMRTIAAVMLLVSTAHADELVGRIVPPFPNGMYAGGGACAGPGRQDPCHRTVNVLFSAGGKKVGVYTAVSTGRSGFWIVSDILPYPKIGKGHDLVWGS